jgi:formate dehydrogenase subunit gamma
MRKLVARALWLIVASVLSLPALAPGSEPARQQAERQQAQPYNNAPVWREVRSEKPGVTQSRGREAGVLIQSAGQTWRQLHNGPLPLFGGLLLVVVMAAIGLFYKIKGPMRLHEPTTGRLIERFTPWERLVHWTTAITFCLLALSGLILTFGKYVLLPVFGYTLFGWLGSIAKNLHNFVGPLFIFCSLVMFVTYVRDNLWRKYDFRWLAKAGGLFSGKDVPSGRFNAGEKLWFWIGVTLLGICLAVTGLILDFPNFNQTRAAMQQANIVHAIAALLYMAAALGHIYLGTIGMDGAYEAMRFGYVDETWAKEHHQYWYEQVKAGTSEQKYLEPVGNAQPQL